METESFTRFVFLSATAVSTVDSTLTSATMITSTEPAFYPTRRAAAVEDGGFSYSVPMYDVVHGEV